MPNTSREQERAAECQRLIEEIGLFSEELNDWEQKFIIDMDDRLTKWGLATHVSDLQFDKLSEIYRRVIEKS